MDPATGLVVKAIALPLAKKYAGKFLANLVDPNTSRFKEQRDEMFRDWQVETTQLVHELAEESVAAAAGVDERVAEIEAKLAERADDAEGHAVFANYALQAYQEPIEERRKMLEYAAAGIIDVRLTVAEHARVQRRLRELEPIDVLTLYGLSRTYGRVFARQCYANEHDMRGALLTANGGGDALWAAGCVRIAPEPSGTYISVETPFPDVPALVITDFGRLLLRVMRGYSRARAVPFAVPGREQLAAERSREDGLSAFPSINELRRVLALLVAAREPTASRYQAPQWSTGERNTGRDCTPPEARTAGRLDVEGLAAHEAERVRILAPKADSELTQSRIAERIAIESARCDGGDTWAVHVYGPHDVIRHLADDLDVRWF